jgi:hypothetical protein
MGRPAALAFATMFTLCALPARGGDEPEHVPNDHVPDKVRASVDAVQSGTTIQLAIRRTDARGEVVYEITFGKKGEAARLFLSSEGRVDREERVVALADAPKPVRRAVSGDEVKQVFAVLPRGEPDSAKYEVLLVRDGKKRLVALGPDGEVKTDEVLDAERLARITAASKELLDAETGRSHADQDFLRKELRVLHEWLDSKVIRVGTSRALVTELLGDLHSDSATHEEWAYATAPRPSDPVPANFFVVEFQGDVVTRTSFRRILDLDGGK